MLERKSTDRERALLDIESTARERTAGESTARESTARERARTLLGKEGTAREKEHC